MSAYRNFFHEHAKNSSVMNFLDLYKIPETPFRQVDNSHASNPPQALSHYSNEDGSECNEKISIPSIKSKRGSHNPTSGPVDPSSQMNTIFHR